MRKRSLPEMTLSSRLLRVLARRLRPDRGSVLVLTAVVTVASLGAAAFAVDIGRGVAFKRELQADADLAALDAARALGNRKGEGGMSPQVHAEKLAKESLARNDFNINATGNSWAVTLGVVHPVTRAFTPTDPSVATAVEVALTGPIDWAFQPGGQTYTARGVAEAGSQKDVCIGSCDLDPGAPVAVDDVAGLCQDDPPITINVLANDSGLSDTPVTVGLGAVSPAGAGSVSPSGNDAVFTADPAFTGDASFSYTVTDADGDADTATVTVTVSAPCAGDHLPVAADDAASLCNLDPPVTIAVLANDWGLEDTPVSVSLGAVSPGGAGSVSLTGNHAEFTPSPTYSGDATFPYTVTDGDGDGDTATVTVTLGACDPDHDVLAGIALGSFLARVDTSGGLLKDVFGRFLNGNVTLVGYQGIAAGSVTLRQVQAALNFGTVDELLTTEITARNFLLAMVTVLQNKGDAASVQAATDLMDLALAADSTLTMTLGDVVQVAQGAGGAAAAAELNAFALAMMTAQLANGQNVVDITLTSQNMGAGLAGLLNLLGGNTLRLKVIEPMQIKFGPPGRYDNGQWKTEVKTAQVRAQIHLRPLATISGTLLDLPIYVQAASATAALRSITCREPINDSQVVVRTNSQAVRANVGEVADINASGSVTVDQATILSLLLTQVVGSAQVNLASSGGDLDFTGPFNWSNTQTIGSTTLDLGALLRAQPVSLTLLGLNVAGLLNDVLGIINPILSEVDEGLINRLLANLGVSLGGGDVTVWGIDCGDPVLVG